MRAQRAGRRIGSFDRTYEGLKPSSPHRQGGVFKTFDRTYEGLKQDPVLDGHVLPHQLLTVPMRV